MFGVLTFCGREEEDSPAQGLQGAVREEGTSRPMLTLSLSSGVR